MNDWTPLAEDDPLPGDPDGLAGLVVLLRSEANGIRDALTRLGAVNTEEFWEGEAATIFADSRGRVGQDLEMVVGRIQATADALNAFVPAMGDCQSRARVAVNRAREADASLAKGRLGADEATRQAVADQAAADAWAKENPGATLPPPPAYWGPNWDALIEEAEQARREAARAFASAVQDYEAAADRCAHALHPAIADHLRNPQSHGLFSRAVHAVGAVASTGIHAVEDAGEVAAHGIVAAGERIYEANDALRDWSLDHLDLVSEGLAIAAMGTGFVPGLQGVSFALTGAKMAVDTGLALAGRGDWKTVGADAFGFVTFGAARAVTGMSRLAAGAEAARKVTTETIALQKAVSEAAEGEQIAAKTVRIAELSQKVRRAKDVAAEFAQDAGQSRFRDAVGMMGNLHAELPGEEALSLSRTAARYAFAAKGIETYEQYTEGKELREILERHGTFGPEASDVATSAAE